MEPSVTDDDLLALVLTCCHPSLSPEAQVALTLRQVAGLEDVQIAAMLLLAPATATKRLVRARAKIRSAQVPFGVPDRQRLNERLNEVRAIVYLIFTEGYFASTDGPAVRRELCEEAVWLARHLHQLLPDDDETAGLYALLLLQNARTRARIDAFGAITPYAEQDRALWDETAIAKARTVLATTTGSPPGSYQLEATIALLHCSPTSTGVNWGAIGQLYDVLQRLDARVSVTVNRAFVKSRTLGPVAGLVLLIPLLEMPQLRQHLPLQAL